MKKKVLDAIYRVICHTSIAFTAILFYFWIFIAMAGGNAKALHYEYISEFFKFAVIFGLSSLIAFIPKIPSALKLFIRFTVNTVAFIGFISGLGDGSQNARFVLIFMFILIYAIVTVASVLLGKLTDRKANEDVRAETTEE